MPFPSRNPPPHPVVGALRRGVARVDAAVAWLGIPGLERRGRLALAGLAALVLVQVAFTLVAPHALTALAWVGPIWARPWAVLTTWWLLPLEPIALLLLGVSWVSIAGLPTLHVTERARWEGVAAGLALGAGVVTALQLTGLAAMGPVGPWPVLVGLLLLLALDQPDQPLSFFLLPPFRARGILIAAGVLHGVSLLLVPWRPDLLAQASLGLAQLAGMVVWWRLRGPGARRAKLRVVPGSRSPSLWN
jgi:hypothetical protein